MTGPTTALLSIWVIVSPDPRAKRCLVLHAVGLAMPGLSPGRRCALTAPFHPCLCRLEPAIGGLFSVALSRTDPGAKTPGRWVGVTHHRVLPCSDFPPARQKKGGRSPRPCRGLIVAHPDSLGTSITPAPLGSNTHSESFTHIRSIAGMGGTTVYPFPDADNRYAMRINTSQSMPLCDTHPRISCPRTDLPTPKEITPRT